MKFVVDPKILPKVRAVLNSPESSNFKVALENIRGFLTENSTWAINKISKIDDKASIYSYRFNINTRIVFTYEQDKNKEYYIVILDIISKNDQSNLDL